MAQLSGLSAVFDGLNRKSLSGARLLTQEAFPIGRSPGDVSGLRPPQKCIGIGIIPYNCVLGHFGFLHQQLII